MFDFETTTIINSMSDPAFAGVSSHTGSETIKDHPRFWVDKNDADNPVLRIAHGGRFAKKNIKSVYKRAWEDPQYFKVTFDMTKVPTELDGLARMVVLVEVHDSNDVIYVDAYSRHRKPFFFEFPIKKGQAAADIAKTAARIANKYGQLIQGNALLSVTADGANVVITTKDEYLRVHEAKLEIYDDKATTFDNCAFFGEYEEAGDGVVVNQGKPGYGTYRQLVKDLFLPTEAHREWANPFEDEAPIVGAHYNEYTVTLCVERTGLGGLSAVGQQIVSTTTHTFYVLDNGGEAASNPAAAFEAALNEVADPEVAETADKDYDDVPVDDQAAEESLGDSAKIIKVQTDAQGAVTSNTKGIKAAAGLEKGQRVPKKAAAKGE